GRAEIVLPANGVSEVAWLGSRLAVLEADRIVLFDGAVPMVERRLPGPLRGLRASPRGTWLAVTRGRRVLVLDQRLRIVRSVTARAIGWSPDEQELAIASAKSIRVERAGRAVTTIPIAAHDLAWR
ncbi:MAG: hypothetical protein QOE36_63, partial [Gaiellaceae bacterium]|nr:hypothetical protein [Gaiellaceae bacterium]